LGYYIKVNTTSQNLTSRTKTSAGGFKKTRKGTGKPKLIFPKDLIKAKLIEKGLANEKGKPRFNGKLIFLSDYEIVKRYNSIIKGFINFENITENRSSMRVYIIEFSLAHTIAAKHRMLLKGVFKKYGKPIKVRKKSDKGEVLKTVEFDLPQSLSAEYLNKKYMKINRWNNTINEILPYDFFNSIIHKAQEKHFGRTLLYLWSN